MMCKQNKGSDFLPMQTRKNSELSIILTSLIFHCKLARINFCPPRSSTGKWWFCGGNSAETRWTKNKSRWEMEWGIRKIRGGLKNQPHRFGGGGGGGGGADFEKPPELYCIYHNTLLVLRFYNPVNPTGPCQVRTVNLTTLLLGRLSSKLLTSIVHIYLPETDNCAS